MGEDVAARDFTREDRRRYREKVQRCLDVFARMLAEHQFEADPKSIGLEIELNPDGDFQTELAQFNVEINVAPTRLAGGALGGLEERVRTSLNHAQDRA